MIAVAENKYGKSRVRLVQVKRRDGCHDLREWTIEILLQGDFDSCFVEGDNSKILPTDTMKNTVYSLARNSTASCMEDFAKELIDFLLHRNPQVSAAEVSISEKPWQHLALGGKPHPTTFVQTSSETQTAKIARNNKKESEFSITAGFENLVIMKTANSAFEGYIQDSLTTLPPAKDRLLGTAVRANWNYTRPVVAFSSLRATVREILLTQFAAHDSKSVQHTLFAMGKAVLEEVAEVEDIELAMPNKHCLLVDLSRFGQDNPNEIFVPVDEPHGNIQARLCRHLRNE
ncbi:MAG: factor-independent urate hydroxylase [Terriglobales bacterium]